MRAREYADDGEATDYAEYAEDAEATDYADYAEDAEATDYAEYAEDAGRPDAAMPRTARLLARLIPAGDRESILGDLLEDAAFRNLAGARRDLWLTGECAAIAGGLSIQRARGWVVVPPVREVAAGLALDGRGALRGDHPIASLARAALFCGCVATLVLGVELLVGSLLSASGF